MVDGPAAGFSGGFVDDLIRAGSSAFRELSRKTYKLFEMDEYELITYKFSGFHLKCDEERCITQHQSIYLLNLKHLPLDARFTDFHSNRMRLAWLENSRPDFLFEISQLAQVTENRFNKEKNAIIRRLNKALKYNIENIVKIKTSPSR